MIFNIGGCQFIESDTTKHFTINTPESRVIEKMNTTTNNEEYDNLLLWLIEHDASMVKWEIVV